MKITIKTSGGFGGFGLGQAATTIDVESLAPGMRKRAEKALSPNALRALRDRASPRGAADRIVYEIGVSDGDDSAKVEIGEGALPPKLIDLIDQLRNGAKD